VFRRPTEGRDPSSGFISSKVPRAHRVDAQQPVGGDRGGRSHGEDGVLGLPLSGGGGGRDQEECEQHEWLVHETTYRRRPVAFVVQWRCHAVTGLGEFVFRTGVVLCDTSAAFGRCPTSHAGPNG